MGKIIDSKNSQEYRNILTGLVLLLAAGMIVLVMYVGTNDVSVSKDNLVGQGIFFIVPIICILYFGRKTLLDNRTGRQATVGIVGSILGIILTRWAGLKLDISPEQVLVFEKFVVAIGLSNTPPVIPSGLIISLCFIISGVGSILVPQYQWFFDIFSIALLFFFLAKDYVLELRHR